MSQSPYRPNLGPCYSFINLLPRINDKLRGILQLNEFRRHVCGDRNAMVLPVPPELAFMAFHCERTAELNAECRSVADAPPRGELVSRPHVTCSAP
ncbi:unnamed protein product, partial [Iphiclides podalirius]